MGFFNYLIDMLVLFFLFAVGMILVFQQMFVFLIDKAWNRTPTIMDILTILAGIICLIGAMWLKRKWNM